MRRLATGLLVLALAACGAPEIGRLGDSSPSASQSPGQRYEWSGTVLQSSEHRPELCSIVAESYPPQCGGVPVAGWDWGDVHGEERSGGTIWGGFRVVGTYDGKTFTITERPGSISRSSEDIKISSACTKPAGGWERPNPDRAGEQEMQKAFEAAGREPDYAGGWLSDAEKVDANGVQDLSTAVLNFGFTGDLERHEAEIRRIWGGGLCLVKRDRTLSKLQSVALEAHSYADSIGLEVRTSNANEVTWNIEIGVFFADAAAQKKMDDRFPGVTVKLLGEIKPVG